MSKTLRQAEFEINASQKIIFPYLNTAGGLQEWFADDVTINSNKVYNFLWDGEIHAARLVSQKPNKSVKFEYLGEEGDDDPSWVELDLQVNELTQALYFQVSEYSDATDSDEEFYEMWEGLIDTLKDVVGA